MPLRPGTFCIVLLLVACATQTERPVAKVAAAPPPPGVAGTILAMRPVPAESAEPARILLVGLGVQAAPADSHVFEFIVRTADGTTISVVQPQTGGLHPSALVSILSGAETRIDALDISASR